MLIPLSSRTLDTFRARVTGRGTLALLGPEPLTADANGVPAICVFGNAPMGFRSFLMKPISQDMMPFLYLADRDVFFPVARKL